MSHRNPKIEKIETLLDRFGNLAVEGFHYIALFVIGCMVIWSAGNTVFEILGFLCDMRPPNICLSYRY